MKRSATYVSITACKENQIKIPENQTTQVHDTQYKHGLTWLVSKLVRSVLSRGAKEEVREYIS